MSRRVLFVCNDPSAPQALLGDVFTESGFDITTFDVVPVESVHEPAVEVSFPDPTGFDVIVPDLRGFGDSDLGPDGFHDVASHALDLHALVHECARLQSARPR